MRPNVRAALGLALTLLASGSALGQAPARAPAGGAPQQKAQRPAVFDKVVATVNGDNITAGEVVQYLSNFPIQPGEEAESYRDAVDGLVNFKLVKLFLIKEKVAVTEKELDEEQARFEKALKDGGGDLASALAQSGTSLDTLRKEMANTLRWKNYVLKKGTDAELKAFVEANKDLFYGTQVRASHIMVKSPETASAADKAKAKAKIDAIKAEIDGGTIKFADAANKYSEDDRNVAAKSGGDLGYFTRKGLTEKFAAAAFAMKKGSISEIVATDYGLHLIQVTDRKEGQPLDFEKQKVAILNAYAADLQEKIVESERKAAKIDIKPMPADLMPARPAGAAPAPGGTAPKAAAPK